MSHPKPRAFAESTATPLRQTAQTSTSNYNRLVALAFIFDFWVAAGAMCLGFYLRFHTPLNSIGVFEAVPFHHYAGHFTVGTILLALLLANFRLYDRKNLLTFTNTMRIVLKTVLIWTVLYLGLTLILKFNPPISRMFCLLSAACMLVMLPVWRAVFWRFLKVDQFATSLRQRALVVGWSEEFAAALDHFEHAHDRPFDIVGVVPPPNGEFLAAVPENMPVMGQYENLEMLLKMRVCQVVVVADDTLRNGKLLSLASLCEKEMIEFKLIPTCFRVLISGLNLETVGGIPVLGISKLPLHSAANQLLKRFVDLLGAIVGLVLTAPIIGVFGALIYRESPGSIFYRQKRLGANGEIFEMIKLRSMKLDAEADGKAGWTVKDDPRCLRVGKFMRRWNIDEIPQFWNVLRGDMSLVGPRPERPELIEDFKEEIPHYNARHNIKPGITGWAQVNGLRGDTDLGERVRFDLHYIENWNVIFDFQIMLLTFFRREGAC
ncbi:MAG: sugar transferase [Verrucomicrobiales bacterium]|nr:sugar transferase [Verrucomicrobiales bacterium]